MASPQLKQAIDAMKQMASQMANATPQDLRRAFDQMAPTPAADVQCQKVNAGGVDAEWVCAPGAADDRFVLYLHGGGYVIGSVQSHRDLMARLSRAAKARVLGLNYRLAPEHPFPAAVDDAVAGYKWLLAQGAKPSRVAVAGDSAGGGLTAATLVAIRDQKLPTPGAGVLISPWVDMEGLGESMKTRVDADPVVRKEGLLQMAQAYLQGKDPKTPLAAPLYADLKGLPPLLIQVGDAETLLDDSNRLAERAKAAGVPTKLEIWPEMIHVWHLFASFLPEGQQAIERAGGFIVENAN
ncbi:MAG TPA: alpha/beta hydrolase [Candidatus Binataceae bacterium]|jgi:acetyl esterase/lipase|nr:alpha/beta hydrolase [Candidatus Binataceae bacterium]